MPRTKKNASHSSSAMHRPRLQRLPADLQLGFPRPGEVLRRLRTQRNLTLRQVADACGLSPSFLASLERGETDIALERLARLAQVFDHDVGSFLGYTARQAQPYILGPDESMAIDRGPGVSYQVLRVPNVSFEMFLVNFPPKTGFSDERVHEGLDITLVTQGSVIATYNHVDYILTAGQCATWSAGYPHSFRNDTDTPAQYVGVVTARLY
jgi:transcriptional regulator with XRE-family HTH domain